MQIAPEVTSALVNLGIPSIVGLQIWLVKKSYAFDSQFARFETWAFGPTGQNGINGRVAKAESEIESLRERQ